MYMCNCVVSSYVGACMYMSSVDMSSYVAGPYVGAACTRVVSSYVGAILHVVSFHVGADTTCLARGACAPPERKTRKKNSPSY